MEHKRPAGAYPLRDFQKNCRVCTPFQDALGVKIWLDLLEELWSYGGFKLRVSGSPIFSVSPSGETMRQTPKVLEVQERARGPLSPCQVWWGLGFHPPPGWPKTLSFFCLFVCRDEIWQVSVDRGSAIAHQIWPSSVKGHRYRSPQNVKICPKL